MSTVDPPLDLTGVDPWPGAPLAELAEGAPDEERPPLLLAVAVAQAVAAAGGRAMVVGGVARDEALRRLGAPRSLKDVDLEVYGLPVDRLRDLLAGFGEADLVGTSFAVVKLADPWMPFREAARRRDFTINALALDPLTGDLLDAWGGVDDLRTEVLRACDPGTFADDPLRVLRAAQFAGRFGFTVTPETAALCRALDLRELPTERVGEEWRKLLLRSPRPGVGLAALRELGVLARLHPEFEALAGTPQDPRHHPEGDVLAHTGLVLDAMAEEASGMPEEARLVLLLAALCHDLGKPETTVVEGDRVRSPGHAEAGARAAAPFLLGLHVSMAVVHRVVPLVREHMHEGLGGPTSDAAVRRLAVRLDPATIAELVALGRADRRGRGDSWTDPGFGRRLLAQAEGLTVATGRPAPLVQGRDLLALGLVPGPSLGETLRGLYAAQLDGAFRTTEEGVAFHRAGARVAPD